MSSWVMFKSDMGLRASSEMKSKMLYSRSTSQMNSMKNDTAVL